MQERTGEAGDTRHRDKAGLEGHFGGQAAPLWGDRVYRVCEGVGAAQRRVEEREQGSDAKDTRGP